MEKITKIDIETIIEQLEKEKSQDGIKQKPLSEFRNNQKNFQYDYEEDFYEPRTESYSDEDY